MANEKQLERLNAGVREWNEWRGEREGRWGRQSVYIDLEGADLSHANLSDGNLSKVDLRGANLHKAILNKADLSRARLDRANLSAARLFGANLNGADLSVAKLTGADLSHANLVVARLSEADLFEAVLFGADLRRANLSGANARGANFCDATLIGAGLEGTDLGGAILGVSSLTNLNLSETLGLALVQHQYPSDIGVRTLEHTARGLKAIPPERRGEVEVFLRGAGVPELVMQAFQLMVESPIEFYSVFISYSHRDKPFARRLYEALQARGIRCWLDEHALLPGDDIADSIDHGIRIWDKVLLCCSEDSLRSYWVEAEVDKALEKEQQLRKDRGKKIHAIIPLDLDGYLETWQDGRASMIRKRLAADFTGWHSDHAKFEAQLERVCAALQTERETGPTPKL